VLQITQLSLFVRAILRQEDANIQDAQVIFQFDGEGGWHLDVLDSGTLLSLNEERLKLESQLAGVAKLEERLKEVYALLGEEAPNEDDDDEEEAIPFMVLCFELLSVS